MPFFYYHTIIAMGLQLFNTAAERAAWISQSYTRAITYCVAHNPRGTYQVIKTKYPNFPNWGLGSEQSDAAQEALYKFILTKAKDSGNADRYVTELLAAVPANPSMDNLWIKTS